MLRDPNTMQYNMSQHSTGNIKSAKSASNAGGHVSNSSRNTKVSQISGGGIKSGSHYVANAGPNGAADNSSAYKSKEHIPSSVVQGGGSSKVLKA